MTRPLDEILAESSSRHRHLCPRQVLGTRMSLWAGEILGLDLPRRDKKLLVIAETDGCMLDGVIAATGCHAGGRTLRIRDFGKVAATFFDTRSERAIRVAPCRESRSLAQVYAPGARNPWEAMLLGYQVMPADKLFRVQAVRVTTPLVELVSRPGKKTECDVCQEEIINGREVARAGLTLCCSCAGERYYKLAAEGLAEVQI